MHHPFTIHQFAPTERIRQTAWCDFALRLYLAPAMRGDFRNIDFVSASTLALVFGVGGTLFRDGVFALGTLGKITRGGLHFVIRRDRRSTSSFFDFDDRLFFRAVGIDSDGMIFDDERNGIEEENEAPMTFSPTQLI